MQSQMDEVSAMRRRPGWFRWRAADRAGLGAGHALLERAEPACGLGADVDLRPGRVVTGPPRWRLQALRLDEGGARAAAGGA